MNLRKWDRSDAIIAAIAVAIVTWCAGWAYVACHFIVKWW